MFGALGLGWIAMQQVFVQASIGFTIWHFLADARVWRLSDPLARSIVRPRFDFVFGPPPICEAYGNVDFTWFNNYLTNTLLPELTAQGVNPSNLPIFFTHNLAFALPPSNNFFNWGFVYHDFTGLQTYVVGDFDTSAFYVGPPSDPDALDDTNGLSHEIAEWMNDPFGTNPIPTWENPGYPFPCADNNNLEVGDPLQGVAFPPVTMPNGFTYHLQELAFFSWFYGAPSIGVNGWFCNNGTFLTDAGPPCQ